MIAMALGQYKPSSRNIVGRGRTRDRMKKSSDDGEEYPFSAIATSRKGGGEGWLPSGSSLAGEGKPGVFRFFENSMVVPKVLTFSPFFHRVLLLLEHELHSVPKIFKPMCRYFGRIMTEKTDLAFISKVYLPSSINRNIRYII